MIPPTFRCRHCGGDTYVEPDDWSAICTKCCGERGEHEWYHERGEGWLCIHCNDMAPPDYGYDDDGFGGVPLFSPREPDEPIGTPLSELAGRPDGTIDGQRRYENFKRIAASWGYD